MKNSLESNINGVCLLLAVMYYPFPTMTTRVLFLELIGTHRQKIKKNT